MAPPEILVRLSNVVDLYNLKEHCFKPQQVKCWEHLFLGKDVIGVLPTGFGKSIIFQLLSDVLPPRTQTTAPGTRNIVLVVGPLNSIMDDQLESLKTYGIQADILKRVDNDDPNCYKLFGEQKEDDDIDDVDVGEKFHISDNIRNGNVNVLLGHPEAFMSDTGKQLLRSSVYQNNVVAITIDEAHCVETW
jgi:ATP-dependent DNA helicase RecQ